MTSHQPDTFGVWLKQTRTDKGFSQRRLADAIRIEQANLSKIENGERQPTADHAIAIASVLELDVVDVLLRAGKLPAWNLKHYKQTAVANQILSLMEGLSDEQQEQALRVLEALVAAPGRARRKVAPSNQ